MRASTNRLSAWAALAGLGSLGLLGGAGCGSEPQEPLGHIAFALDDGLGGWFRLRIFAGAPAADLGGELVFDTGCVEAISRTYELTNIPVGAGRSVVFEGFNSATCESGARVGMGFRGDVEIAQSTRPYYHIPMVLDGEVSALPEDLNLSAAVAEPIDFCDADTDCDAAVGGPSPICYDGSKPEYWCVPSCIQDADCGALHPRASCDTAAGWCMLYSPFPLNLSEPRALGKAVTLASGSVAFIGGAGAIEGGRLVPTQHLVEVFDQAKGLFVAAAAEGVSDWPAGLFGFGALGGDRFALVGGVSSLALAWDGARAGLATAGNSWDEILRGDLIVVDPVAGKAASSPLTRPVAQPTVVPLGSNQLLVAGGAAGEVFAPTRDAWICTVGDDLVAGCEGIVPMNVARIGAAGACLDADCKRVLIVGGADSAPIAEVLDRTGDVPVFRPLAVEGLTGVVYDPILCGMDLVSASRSRGAASDIPAFGLEVSEDGLTARPDASGRVAPYLAAAVPGAGGECFVGGGLLKNNGVTDQVLRGKDGALTAPGWNLERARFGAAAAAVGAGPLAGRVLFAGGLTVPDLASPGLVLVRGAEVLTP